MLHAILSSKAGRNLYASANWRKEFSDSEDSLTSFVFSLISYLPPELAWRLLVDNPASCKLPGNPGILERIDFWPRWSRSGTDNYSFVEPDVFIRFQFADLIVEAKRFDTGAQNHQQWERELQAYSNEMEGQTRTVCLLAIGGNPLEKSSVTEFSGKITECPVIQLHWRTLAERVKAMLEKFSRTQSEFGVNSSLVKILEDLSSVFSLHGFAIIAWLDSLCPTQMAPSEDALQNLSANFNFSNKYT